MSAPRTDLQLTQIPCNADCHPQAQFKLSAVSVTHGVLALDNTEVQLHLALFIHVLHPGGYFNVCQSQNTLDHARAYAELIGQHYFRNRVMSVHEFGPENDRQMVMIITQFTRDMSDPKTLPQYTLVLLETELEGHSFI